MHVTKIDGGFISCVCWVFVPRSIEAFFSKMSMSCLFLVCFTQFSTFSSLHMLSDSRYLSSYFLISYGMLSIPTLDLINTLMVTRKTLLGFMYT
jgi:hypothetical protein